MYVFPLKSESLVTGGGEEGTASGARNTNHRHPTASICINTISPGEGSQRMFGKLIRPLLSFRDTPRVKKAKGISTIGSNPYRGLASGTLSEAPLQQQWWGSGEVGGT